MATKKPQFSCYLDPQIDAEIEAHLTKTGQAKGKLIEQLWRFYNFRDQVLMLERFATQVSKELSEKDKKFIERLLLMLKTTSKGDNDDRT